MSTLIFFFLVSSIGTRICSWCLNWLSWKCSRTMKCNFHVKHKMNSMLFLWIVCLLALCFNIFIILMVFCWCIMILLVYYDFWHCAYIGFACVCFVLYLFFFKFLFAYMSILLILWKEREEMTWSLMVVRCKGYGRRCVREKHSMIIMYKIIINYVCILIISCVWI